MKKVNQVGLASRSVYPQAGKEIDPELQVWDCQEQDSAGDDSSQSLDRSVTFGSTKNFDRTPSFGSSSAIQK